MFHRTSRHPSRKGAIAPLTAVLLIPMVALLAFAIDLGYITHTHNELQAAADAAALAGASQLPEGFVQYHLPDLAADKKTSIRTSYTTKAKQSATTYAGYNPAAYVSSLTLLDGDIQVGVTDASANFTAQSSSSGFPNTVKVTLRRDATANGSLGLFFARVIGMNTVDLTATATAGIYAGKIDGFKNPSVNTSRILPMTYDRSDWQAFMKGGPYPSWMATDTDTSGLPRVSVYPTNSDRGSFGELSLDPGNNGASTISGWIDNGVSSYDLQAQYTKGLLPLSNHSENSLPDWTGNSGLKNSTIQTVGDHVGDLYLLPLYKAVNSSNGNYQAGEGQGSNYYYTIVEFVGVKVSEFDSRGNPKSIKVQPSALIDPNALYSSTQLVQPPSGSSPVATTFVGAKLIQ